MRHLLLLSLLCSLIFQCKSRADDPVITDFDRKAAATLYSCLAGKDVKWEGVSPQQMKPGLTRFEKNATTGKATYALDFGGVEGGVDKRGFYRITIGEELTDAAAGGWTSFKTDPKSGVEVLYKKIEKSDAEKYLNIAARKKVGKVILTIAQRRGLTDSVDAASSDINKRFDTLLAQANRNQLFGGKITMILTSQEDQPELPNGEPFLFSMNDNDTTTFIIRIDVSGPDGQPAKDLRHVSLELSGTVAAYAKCQVNGQPADISKRYRVKDPPATITVTIAVPAASDPEVRDILYNNAAGSSSQQSWGLKVGVSQK